MPTLNGFGRNEEGKDGWCKIGCSLPPLVSLSLLTPRSLFFIKRTERDGPNQSTNFISIFKVKMLPTQIGRVPQGVSMQGLNSPA